MNTLGQQNKKKSATERFWSQVYKTSSCWFWLGPTSKGYGHLVGEQKGKEIYAHRFSYILHKGPIASHLKVCHTCDTPTCVNPNHLFVGSDSQNVQDSISKGRRTGFHWVLTV